MKLKSTWIKNSLGYDNDLFIYQDKEMFNYSVDTILLANLFTLNNKIKYVLEIGTNNAALSIFLSERNENLKIDALEIQDKAIELAAYNINLNNKNNSINLIKGDFNEFWKEHNLNVSRKYQAIICNPPFYKKETKIKKNITPEKLIATHEILLNIEEIIKGSSKILEQKGHLSMIVPPERIVDVFVSMRKYNIEPKRVIMIHPRQSQKANLAFIEGKFQGGWGVKFEENIYLHPENTDKHIYTQQVIDLYKPQKVDNYEKK